MPVSKQDIAWLAGIIDGDEMILYTYQCRICGNQFEKFQPLGARDLASCPECCCVAEKKLSPVNFTFGFRLSDESMWVKGHKDELIRDV